MRKVTRYICELCGATYEAEDKARECEASHKIGKILNFEYAGGSRYPYIVTLKFDGGEKVPYIIEGEGVL